MVETNFNERTGQTEYWDNATARWIPFNGEDGIPTGTDIPSLISIEDIKNKVPFTRDPYYGTLVADPNATAPTDPNEYYKQLGTELSKDAYSQWSINGDASQYQNLIEGLKDISPQGYYTAKIDELSRGIGHQYQSNQMARGDVVKQQLQDILPEAQKAGVTPEEINSIYGSGYSQGAQGFAQILQGQQSAGGPYTPLWEGLKFVGPGALGMYGIDAALTAGLGAAYGAASGLSSAGIGSGLGTAAELSGALASGAGSIGAGSLGGAGLIGPTYAELGFTGLEGGFAGPSYAEMGFTGLNQAEAIAAANAASGAPVYDYSQPLYPEQMGPTYQELGYTGVEGGFAGPTYEELGYTGLNQNEAIAAADAASKAASGSSLLSNASDLLKGTQLVKGLLGAGQNPLQAQAVGAQPQQQIQQRQYAGVDYSPILNLLAVKSPQRNRNSLLG